MSAHTTAREEQRPPRLIALDWGTSSLRGYLVGDGGVVLEARAEPWGIMHLPTGGFVRAFDEMTSEWRRRAPGVAIIASGMVGSAQGWKEASYCDAPAGATELAHALAQAADDGPAIVPGVALRGDRPDVMRGEETQIVGALAMHPELAVESIIVLPGTHSKWVRVRGGRIESFATYMTGELFSVLSTASILGRFARETKRDASTEAASEAFARGVLAARAASGGIASLLFSARALVLTGVLAAEASLEYLSGLLVGDEVRSGLDTHGVPDALVGEPGLCDRYRRALRLFGAADAPVIANAAPAGLWAIAQHASLGATGRRVVA